MAAEKRWWYECLDGTFIAMKNGSVYFARNEEKLKKDIAERLKLNNNA